MAEPLIRPEAPSDVAAIHALHAACFPTDAETTLVDLLRAAGDLSISLAAECDGVIVGHVAFSPVRLANEATYWAGKKDAKIHHGAGLAPVSVAATHRRRGIAEKLIRAGLASCGASGFGWVVVLGEPAYYARFGFLPAPKFGLMDEYGGGKAFQCLELTGNALPLNGGLVKYAPAFASLG